MLDPQPLRGTKLDQRTQWPRCVRRQPVCRIVISKVIPARAATCNQPLHSNTHRERRKPIPQAELKRLLVTVCNGYRFSIILSIERGTFAQCLLKQFGGVEQVRLR
jgi:hypothetical protein